MFRKKQLFKKTAVLGMALCLLFTSGCATGSEEPTEVSYLDLLNDGTYYVRHDTKTGQPECENIYFGASTFDFGEVTSNPSNGRIMWFKEDFSSIPTLRPGDSLILYTSEILGEIFTFERFEDLGYSVGICGMSVSASGRYDISTNPDERCTYPGGDTDGILKLTNGTVKLDTIGGQPIRSIGNKGDAASYLSRCGTIKNLDKDKEYQMEIYEGTVRHPFVFKANVRVLGSMEVLSTTDYEFESEKIIKIHIPQCFNSGYYLLNGIGMFRYQKNNEDFELASAYNIPNDYENYASTDIATSTGTFKTIYENEQNPGQSDTDNKKNENSNAPQNRKSDGKDTFTITEPINLQVTVGFTIPSKYEGGGDGLPDVSAIVVFPSGRKYAMYQEGEELKVIFYADEVGVYEIHYYDLEIRNPVANVQAI